MDNRELLRTLSGCRFYRQYLEAQQAKVSPPQEPAIAPSPPPQQKRRRARRVYRKYSTVVGILLAAGVVLIITPLWLVHPPYGKAFLLSLPPMLICALSWMAGVWWAWDKDRFIFLAVTIGATPARLFLGLAWAWLVLSIPGISDRAFVLGLMWHWLIFTIPEFTMAYELSQNPRFRPYTTTALASPPAASEANDGMS